MDKRTNELLGRSWWVVFIIMLAVLSLAIIAVPYVNDHKIPMIIDGVFLWLGLLGTLASAFAVTWLKIKSGDYRDIDRKNRHPGIIRIFENKAATVADIVMIASAVGLTLILIFRRFSIVAYYFLAILLFSFGMHCMLNGTDYKYINNCFRRHNKL